MVTNELFERSESLAVRLRTYVPAALKLAVVAAVPGFAKVTVPGPLTLFQTTVSVLPTGRPSSPAVPVRLAVLGKVIVWFRPALTDGGWFTGNGGLTVTATSSLRISWESLAVRRST